MTHKIFAEKKAQCQIKNKIELGHIFETSLIKYENFPCPISLSVFIMPWRSFRMEGEKTLQLFGL